MCCYHESKQSDLGCTPLGHFFVDDWVLASPPRHLENPLYSTPRRNELNLSFSRFILDIALFRKKVVLGRIFNLLSTAFPSNEFLALHTFTDLNFLFLHPGLDLWRATHWRVEINISQGKLFSPSSQSHPLLSRHPLGSKWTSYLLVHSPILTHIQCSSFPLGIPPPISFSHLCSTYSIILVGFMITINPQFRL